MLSEVPFPPKNFRGLRPLVPAKGSAPGPRWGLRPQTPAAARYVRNTKPDQCSSLRSRTEPPPPKEIPGYVPVSANDRLTAYRHVPLEYHTRLQLQGNYYTPQDKFPHVTY